MKKLLLAGAGLAALLGLALLLPAQVGRAQNPAGKGEAITVPVAPSGGGQAIPPNSTQALFQTAPVVAAPDLPTSPAMPNVPRPSRPAREDEQPHTLREYLSQNPDNVDLNDDIAVQPSCGEYMICLNWYSGPEAPQSARALALEMRGPDFGFKAYVFTKGLEERKAALQKMAEDVEKQRQQLAKLGLENDAHIRVPLIRYEIQCAVLVGGFKDMESAHHALEQLRKCSADKLKEKNVPLHSVMSDVKLDKDGQPCYGKVGLVNPFTHAIVVANPTVKMPERPKGMTAEDVALLRTLNEDEPYSLLKCPKAYTIAVRKFSMPACIDSKKSGSSMWDKIGLGSASKVDTAAVSAHNLADLLNKNATIKQPDVRAWVLHTKFCSYVTVGSFDSPDDPKIRSWQEELPKLNTGEHALHPSIQLVAHPPLMPVPR